MERLGFFRMLSLALCASMMTVGAYAQSGRSTVVSVQQNRLSDSYSQLLDIGAGGSIVLFLSAASNLVPGDTNHAEDLFLYTLHDGKIVRLSVGPSGEQANGAVITASMDKPGQIIVMETSATNLVPGVVDTNQRPDILLYRYGRWRYLSVSPNGAPTGGQSPIVTPDGRYAAWIDTSSNRLIRIYDTETGTTRTIDISRVGTLWGIAHLPGDDGTELRVLYSDAGGLHLATIGNTISQTPLFTGSPVGAARLSPSGGIVAYHHPDTGEIIVYSVARREPIWVSPPARPKFDISDNYLVYAPNTADRISLLSQRQLDTGHERIVSIRDDGREQGGGFFTTNVRISDDGSVVAFAEPDRGTPWVQGDRNQVTDVFVRLVDEGKTIGVTVGRGELATGAPSGSLSLDFSAQRMVFASAANNLVPNDTNDKQDIFIRYPDGTLDRIVGPGGVEPNGDSYDPQISADGRYVVFRTYATNLGGPVGRDTSVIYLYDISTRQLRLLTCLCSEVMPANGSSFSPRISRDARHVVFISEASNLVSYDRNSKADVFLYNTLTNQITRLTPSEQEPNGDAYEVDISPDGRYIVFSSDATNWVHGDSNNAVDVFVYDRQTNTVLRITQDGVQLNDSSSHPSISEDGQFVAFASNATNIDTRDRDTATDIYVWDRDTNRIELVSVNSYGIKGNAESRYPSISADGRRVAFESDATNFMPLDGTPDTDVFVYDRTTGWLYAVVANDCLPGDAPSFAPVLSGDGNWVGMQTNASNLGMVPLGADAYAMVHRVGCVPPGDVNRDGTVDDADLLEVLFRFGGDASCADLNFDDAIDDADLLIVLFNFGSSCPQFAYGGGDDGNRSTLGELYPELFEGMPQVEIEEEGDTLIYRTSAMRPADYKSLDRQAMELEMAHRGLWPYPVAGRGSEPWIEAYGDPLTMDEAQLSELLERFHNPSQGDFAPASGTFTYSQSKTVSLGGSDVNISVTGSIYFFATCANGGSVKAEAKGDANIKFFSLNYTVAEAYGLAEASNSQAKLNAYVKVAGQTLWSWNFTQPLSYTYASSCHYGGDRSNIGPWTRQWTFEKTWWLGPVPVKVRAGITLEAGACYKFHASLAPVKAEARFRPYVQSSAFASGGVAFNIGCSASAGVGISLTLLNDALEAYATLNLGSIRFRCCVFLNAGIHNTITALSGRFYIYAEACCWGLSGSKCGWSRKRQSWQHDLFNWSGFSNSGHLWGPWSYVHCF